MRTLFITQVNAFVVFVVFFCFPAEYFQSLFIRIRRAFSRNEGESLGFVCVLLKALFAQFLLKAP